jgi:predicted nucleic acid-binding protein
MTCIADANVLFPLLVQGHAAYEVAKGWWDQQSDGTVGTCLLTRLAVLRLLTNRVAMNGAPVSPDEALKAWGRLSKIRVRSSLMVNRLNMNLASCRLSPPDSPHRICGPMRGLPRSRCHSTTR